MNKVQLIHWNENEAKERADWFKAIGYEISYEMPRGQNYLKELRQNPPLAVVIDLSRLPSQGRDFGIAIRKPKATRHVPLVFVGGDPKKVSNIKEILPDAVYTSWEQIQSDLKHAISNPPEEPVAPKSLFAGYSGKPLTDKLGIKPNYAVALLDAPKDFKDTLGNLPDGVSLSEKIDDQTDLIIWFTRSQKTLEGGIKQMAPLVKHRAMWITWPKKASSMTSDLTQQIVRKIGLATGLVDYKICSIDKTWSGLLFTTRKPK